MRVMRVLGCRQSFDSMRPGNGIVLLGSWTVCALLSACDPYLCKPGCLSISKATRCCSGSHARPWRTLADCLGMHRTWGAWAVEPAQLSIKYQTPPFKGDGRVLPPQALCEPRFSAAPDLQ